MRKILLSAVALAGLTALAVPHRAEAAVAAMNMGSAPIVAEAAGTPSLQTVQYYWHGHHWHHRRWFHHRWSYY